MITFPIRVRKSQSIHGVFVQFVDAADVVWEPETLVTYFNEVAAFKVGALDPKDYSPKQGVQSIASV